MADKLVTLILPAWNAETTVETAVRSVLNQSYRNLRLVAVDDGSVDETPAILRRLAAEDPRLQVLSVPNGGPAAARNRALSLLGEDTDYVMFLDADDYLVSDAVERALNGAADGAELVIFGYAIQLPDGGVRLYREPEQQLRGEGLYTQLPRLYRANLLSQVWGKLFDAKLLRGLRFPDLRWGEDRLFLFDVLERVSCARVLPRCGYCYVMRPGESLISRYDEGKFAICCKVDARMEALCGSCAPEEAEALRAMFAKSVFSCVTTLFSPTCKLRRREKRAAVRRMLRHPRVRLRCRGASGGFPVRLLCAVLRSGIPELSLLSFRLVALAGECFPGLYFRLKHRK